MEKQKDKKKQMKQSLQIYQLKEREEVKKQIQFYVLQLQFQVQLYINLKKDLPFRVMERK